MILIFLLYGILASTFTIGKMLLFYMPPVFLIAIRMIMAGALLLTINFFTYGKVALKKRSDLLMLFLLSIIHIFIPYVTEFIALQYVNPSCAALMFNLSPFFAAFFSYIYFGEVMTPKKWLGFAIGLLAVIWFLRLDELNMQCWNSKMAYALLLISVISSTLGWIYVRKMVQQSGYSIMFINGCAMLMGGLQAGVISKCFEEAVSLPWDHMTEFLILLFAIIIIGNFVFYNMYAWLLKKYSVTLLSFYGFIVPIFVALFDWIVLGQQVGVDFFFAITLLGGGLYLFYQEELKQGYIK